MKLHNTRPRCMYTIVRINSENEAPLHTGRVRDWRVQDLNTGKDIAVWFFGSHSAFFSNTPQSRSLFFHCLSLPLCLSFTFQSSTFYLCRLLNVLNRIDTSNSRRLAMKPTVSSNLFRVSCVINIQFTVKKPPLFFDKLSFSVHSGRSY